MENIDNIKEELFSELKNRINTNSFQINGSETDASEYSDGGFDFYKLPLLIIALNPSIKIGDKYIQEIGYAYNIDAGDNSSYITFNTNTSDQSEKTVITNTSAPDLLNVFNNNTTIKNKYKEVYNSEKEKDETSSETGMSSTGLGSVGMNTGMLEEKYNLREIVNYFLK